MTDSYWNAYIPIQPKLEIQFIIRDGKKNNFAT